MADPTKRLQVYCLVELPEPLLFPFLRLLRQWEGRQAQEVHLAIDVRTHTSYTTAELRQFLTTLDPPMHVVDTRPLPQEAPPCA